jgi:ABC-type glycerol-3-phosphate transport system substrate-binding protein
MNRRVCFLLATIVAIAMVVLPASLGASPKTTPTTPLAPASLTGLFLNTDQAAFGILVPNFNRIYPGVQIDPVTYLSSSAIDPLILTDLQTNSVPDLFFTHNQNSSANGITQLGGQGKLLDLSSGPWVKRLTDYSRPSVAIGKKVYGYPISLFFEGIAYNQGLWTSSG